VVLLKKLLGLGKKVWVLVWDNASWHVSKEVRTWIAEHNRKVKKGGVGVRIISCFLPTKSPWLNPIEPKWVHGKRRVMEADGLLSAHELAERVCSAFKCPHYEHLSLAENVA
jgi:transposase